MQDIIHSTIGVADIQGKYLDTAALKKLKGYFQTGNLRVEAATKISENAGLIVKEVVGRSLLYTDVTRPGGNMYTTRQYAACIRDLDYYLRYATYAILAGDPSILDERVLNGLKETYNSLGVPIGATVQSIQAMKEVTARIVGSAAGKEMGVYFDYICTGLGYDLAEDKSSASLTQSSPDENSTTEFFKQQSFKRNDKVSMAARQEFWKRSDRAIATGAGAAFLGGLIAQLPGAIAGAVFGALFGLFVTPQKSSHA